MLMTANLRAPRSSIGARRVVLLLLLMFPTGISQAQEPVTEFLDALRAKGYFDTAMDYIAEQEASPSLSDTEKQSLGFERAMTLLAMSRQSRTSAAKATALADAQAALETFAREHPRHPLAAKANTELGHILFERARAAVWQSESPPADKTKEQLRQEARDLIAQARKIFKTAFDMFDARLKSFPAYIDEDDREQRAAFREAQIGSLANELALARCTYEEGQTWERGSDERRKLLLQASKEFQATHEKYRTWMGGLTARLWQGKCFEELDDVATALGIYNEVLGHGESFSGVRELKDLAFRFRLICLNHDKKRDYKLAILQADNWLNEHTTRTRTDEGVGIRWEKARAHEAYGLTLKDDNPEHERQLRLALADAQLVARFDSPYKDVANSMVRRLKTQLGERQGPPKDFDTAFELARAHIKRVQVLKTAAAKASNPEAQRKAREDLRLELQATDDMLSLALKLADSKTDPAQVLQTQYLLAFVKYEQRKSYDAIVLARHVMKHGAELDPQTAMNAAEVAMVACVQAFNDAGDDHQTELELLEQVSNEIIAQWPDTSRANEARMSLGMINHRANRPAEASRWYDAVPESAAEFAEAQIAAGQSWWQAALRASQPDSDPRPDPETLKAWTQNAERHLRAGLKKAGKSDSPSIVAARLSLAQILNGRSAWDESIKLLTEGDQAVVGHVAVPEGTPRPETGITSRNFATLAYQVLLRAYVGTQRIDDALAAMAEMEKIGGDDTQIYIQLGQELEREIERLKSRNDKQRLTQLRQSFEQFLDKVFERKDRQNYNSLVWIAETYRGLGLGMSDDPVAATRYFERAAATYNEILKQNMADGPRKTSVQLRLVNCRRQMKDFEGALTLVREILKQFPRDVHAQFEAAWVLKDWGNSGQPNRLIEAISGSDDQLIWGWIGLAERLRDPRFEEKFFEARYEMAQTRRDLALKGPQEKRKERLESAMRDIELFVETQGAFGAPWWPKFDALYRTLQRDLGSATPQPLEKPAQYAAAPVAAPATEPADSVAAAEPEGSDAATAKPADEGSGMLALGGALVIALLAAGGLWYFMSRPRRTTSPVLASAAAPSFEGVMPAQPRRRKSATASGRREAPGKKASASEPSGDRPTPRRRKARPEAEPNGGSSANPEAQKPRKPRPDHPSA